MASIQLHFTRLGVHEPGDGAPMLILTDQVGVPMSLLVDPTAIEQLAVLAAKEAELTAQMNPEIGNFHRDYGRQLREILLEQESMRSLSDWIRVRVPPRSEQLNLLFSADLPEIADVSWELLAGLTQDEQFDALLLNTCIARVVPVPPRARYHLPSLPAKRIGVALWQALSDDEVVDRLADQLEMLFADLPSQVELLDTRGASAPEVAETIAQFGHPAVLHMVSHGHSADGETFMRTDDKTRDASELQTLLEPICALSGEGCLLGMVMDVCQGAGGRAVSQSPALRLVQSGVPFAFAPQRVLAADSALPWARGFYHALAQGASLYEATTKARASAYDRANPLDWSLQKLFLGHTDWVAQPFLQVRTSKPARSNIGELRQMLLPSAQRSLRAVSSELLGLVDNLTGAGILYNRTHYEAIEEIADELCRQLAHGDQPLEPREALVLLCTLHVVYTGWLDPDADAANLDQATSALQQALADSSQSGDEQSALGYLLSRLASCVPAVWPDVCATLRLLRGRLPDPASYVATPTDTSADTSTNRVRHGLVAALVRLAQRFDAGTHRLVEPSLTARRTPNRDIWRHACSRTALVTPEALRFGFHVPNEAYGHVVRLVCCAEAWTDPDWVFDTLAVAGMTNGTVAPVVNINANGPALRKPNGDLAAAVNLHEDLTHALQSTAPPDLVILTEADTPAQYEMAPFACSGVGEVLRLPFPEEATQRRCRVTLHLNSLEDDTALVEPIILEAVADEHLALRVEQLGVPVGHLVRWRLEVHRGLGRGRSVHQGVFWQLAEPVWTRCERSLAAVDRMPSLVHRVLARASVLRAYGVWADALVVLIEGLNALKGEPAAVRMPLYLMTAGIYDRVIETLSQMELFGRRLAQRVRRHNDALWQLAYSEFDAQGSFPHQPDAADVARVLLREAGLA